MGLRYIFSGTPHFPISDYRPGAAGVLYSPQAELIAQLFSVTVIKCGTWDITTKKMCCVSAIELPMNINKLK
jgi:hypothetical protein